MIDGCLSQVIFVEVSPVNELDVFYHCVKAKIFIPVPENIFNFCLLLVIFAALAEVAQLVRAQDS